MQKRKCLLFLTVALAMVAMFAATQAIANVQLITETTCGDGNYILSFTGVDNGLITYCVRTAPGVNPKLLGKITRNVISQTKANNSVNPIQGLGDFGAGDVAATSWLVGYNDCGTTYTSQISGVTDAKCFSYTAANDSLGNGSMIFDSGNGIITCGDIAVPGTLSNDELGTQVNERLVIPSPPIPDEDGNLVVLEDCVLDISYSPFRGTYVSGDCSFVDASGTQIPQGTPYSLGNILGGKLTKLPEKTKFKKTESPDTNCTYYYGQIVCSTPCCPNPYHCPPYPDCY